MNRKIYLGKWCTVIDKENERLGIKNLSIWNKSLLFMAKLSSPEQQMDLWYKFVKEKYDMGD